MLQDREYCTECRCYHPRNMDLAGCCFQAEAWRSSHELEGLCIETERWYDETIDKAWAWLVKDVSISMPMFNTVHFCGCTTVTHDDFKLDWCFDCLRRKGEESYEN